MIDYFYKQQAEQFSFYRIPKVLFTNPVFHRLSCEAKVLYGLLLDRMCLSSRNGWIDKTGRVYINFTTGKIMEAIGCGNQKASRLLNELEDIGLIERIRRGLGKPNLIYVKNFITDESESHIKKCENHTSGDVEITLPEPPKSHSSNTNLSNTELSNTDSLNSYPSDPSERIDAIRDRDWYRDYFTEHLEYDVLLEIRPNEKAELKEILELLIDTCCLGLKTIRIGGDEKPAETVKSCFMKLNDQHIQFVLDCMKKNTTRIRNIRQYLLTALYNAPMTMNNYFASWVAHDAAGP